MIEPRPGSPALPFAGPGRPRRRFGVAGAGVVYHIHSLRDSAPRVEAERCCGTSSVPPFAAHSLIHTRPEVDDQDTDTPTGIHLWLLPSSPDQVRGPAVHRARPSTSCRACEARGMRRRRIGPPAPGSPMALPIPIRSDPIRFRSRARPRRPRRSPEMNENHREHSQKVPAFHARIW